MLRSYPFPVRLWTIFWLFEDHEKAFKFFHFLLDVSWKTAELWVFLAVGCFSTMFSFWWNNCVHKVSPNRIFLLIPSSFLGQIQTALLWTLLPCAATKVGRQASAMPWSVTATSFIKQNLWGQARKISCFQIQSLPWKEGAKTDPPHFYPVALS